MKTLNTKIYFEMLDDEFQPQKTIFSPNADMLKISKVISYGNKTEDVNEGDLITTYVNNMFMMSDKYGYCSERDIIFINKIPRKGKVHIRDQVKNSLSPFNSATVIESNSEDVSEGDEIYYLNGQSHILPDHTEILSETQIFYKKD